jgi:anti-sigma B factor antagonist
LPRWAEIRPCADRFFGHCRVTAIAGLRYPNVPPAHARTAPLIRSGPFRRLAQRLLLSRAIARRRAMHCTRTDRDGETILRIEGALDAVSAPEMRPVIQSVEIARPPMVTVDLSSLRLIDSSGVGALVSLYKRLREEGASLRAVGVRGQPLAIFKLLRLDSFFCPPADPEEELEAASAAR